MGTGAGEVLPLLDRSGLPQRDHRSNAPVLAGWVHRLGVVPAAHHGVADNGAALHHGEQLRGDRGLARLGRLDLPRGWEASSSADGSVNLVAVVAASGAR